MIIIYFFFFKKIIIADVTAIFLLILIKKNYIMNFFKIYYRKIKDLKIFLSSLLKENKE